jgi:hypothetical protein
MLNSEHLASTPFRFLRAEKCISAFYCP